MTIVQYICGRFKHQPIFHKMHTNGAWIYQCQRCGYENTGFWFEQRKEHGRD